MSTTEPVDVLVLSVATEPTLPGPGDGRFEQVVRERRTLRAVTGDKDTVRLVGSDHRSARSASLTAAHLGALVDCLITELMAEGGPVVALALDRLAERALWGAVQEVDHVLAVRSADAAERLVALIGQGRTPDDILFPPGFNVDRCLRAQAVPPVEGGDRRLVLREGVDGDHPDRWMMLTADHVEVRQDLLSSFQRRAVRARSRTVAPSAPGRRLLIGPANYAGQGWEWARAVRAHCPGWDAANLEVYPRRASLAFGSAAPVAAGEWKLPSVRVELALDEVLRSTHVLVEALRPLLGVGEPTTAADGWDPVLGRQDADALVDSGRQVALLFHGSEVRQPDVHARLTPWSPFELDRGDRQTLARHQAVQRVHLAMDGFPGPRFVSTLDLLDNVPDGTWLPVVVGPGAFAPASPALAAPRPVVAHAPSNSALKGSAWIDPVLDKLDSAGLISYRRVADLPPVAVTALIREADVVVDQVVLGGVGVLAVQAMAAGRLVVAHLPESVRRRFPEPVPVVEATPQTLEQVILSIIEDRAHFARVAEKGITFARTYHDGRLSAQVLSEGFLR
jgi:hypothetical protein